MKKDYDLKLKHQLNIGKFAKTSSLVGLNRIKVSPSAGTIIRTKKWFSYFAINWYKYIKIQMKVGNKIVQTVQVKPTVVKGMENNF